MNRKLKKLIIVGASRSYGNLSRLFIRLFSGIMFMQFGLQQIANYDFMLAHFPSVLGMSSEASLITMIVIEMLFSAFLIFGFFTRFAVIPPIISMIMAEYYILANHMPVAMQLTDSSYAIMMSLQPGYLPLMFIGMFLFILLAGPGRISVDYLLSLYITNKENLNELRNL